MTDDTAQLLWTLGALVLVGSALVARRPSVGDVLRSLLGWAAVAAVAFLVISNRERIAPVMAALGDRIGLGSQSVVGDTVRIAMSEDGHFWARVDLNGHSERMLIDSGATLTAVSPATAKAAGIEVSDSGFPVMLNTANGSITAQRASVGRVTLGSLDTHDLGVVVSPAFGDTNVLGMNFLSRLGSWRVEGKTLILEPKRTRA
ncbi:TIGR02281 family clan AA aspartic protease [Sphingomonas donggukensis]|uniref:TIGR02281 family clan AA aspartic protease n=1 Tax=Sphingomonas donggukensis TaxID=2949093 RepID=A0ABY4U1F7_9SPHN|nr:TIGR02281 family clan AA aspartic protease [Sphingomonas donggukensis]URW76611.1 TIGR02281 family clan AA aspartic protease [Sphingomonas donggukensis]